MNNPSAQVVDSKNSEANERAKLEQEALDDYKNSILKTILEPDAFDRLKRVGIVKPDNVKATESHLLKLFKEGRIHGLVTDDQVRSMLEQVNKSVSTERVKKIEFRRKYVESDDDDSDYF